MNTRCCLLQIWTKKKKHMEKHWKQRKLRYFDQVEPKWGLFCSMICRRPVGCDRYFSRYSSIFARIDESRLTWKPLVVLSLHAEQNGIQIKRMFDWALPLPVLWDSLTFKFVPCKKGHKQVMSHWFFWWSDGQYDCMRCVCFSYLFLRLLLYMLDEKREDISNYPLWPLFLCAFQTTSWFPCADALQAMSRPFAILQLIL